MGAPRFERSTEIVTSRGMFFFASAQQKQSFLDRIDTCNEKWIQYDNLRCSGQWLETDEPPRHFPRAKTHQKKEHGYRMVVNSWCDSL